MYRTNGENNPKVVASIEARMGSSRLPGKVQADICGQPSLTRLLRRLRLCETLDDIILATSTSSQDDILEEWAKAEGVSIHRGSESDVLSRVVEAQQKKSSDVVVEITGDCTLLDPQIIDMGVRTFLQNECDVVMTKGTYPAGMDVLVYKLSDLQENEERLSDPLVREHVAHYIVRHPEEYKTILLNAPRCWHAPHYRFMLDYPEDLEFIRAVYAKLEPDYGDGFGIEEIMSLLQKEPALSKINQMPSSD